MLNPAAPAPLAALPPRRVGGIALWLRANNGAVAMAGLLAFAGPLTFFTGALGVMQAPAAVDIVRLGLWWTLYGLASWCGLLVAGFGCEQLILRLRRVFHAGAWLLAACAVAAFANLSTAGRTTLLVEHGLGLSALTLHLHSFVVTLVMAVIFFAHLRRSREHERAADRLATAQAAQRDARRRIVQARLQEVQARIDPQNLFEMLDALRHLYGRDATRAERFLDELIVFLRAALPRLRSASSSLLRELELAGALVRLRALADRVEPGITIDVAPEATHARFPPGVLLPMLGAVDGRDRPCQIRATRSGDRCRVVLQLGSAPPEASVARVRSLLAALHGAAASVETTGQPGKRQVVVEVPYELA